jgi:hypothetical protein
MAPGIEDGGMKLSWEKRKGRVRGTDVEEGVGTHPWRGRGMVVLSEHLYIICMAGEVEDMRPGGSLNTTDIGIHPDLIDQHLRRNTGSG